MKLVRLAQTNENTINKETLELQRKLTMTKTFRMLAVQRVTTNKGSQTPGIDKILLTEDKDKWNMVEKLKTLIQRPNSYRSQAVKRVYIPKANGKKRPLGIPTMEDRCLQALLNLALEPLVEMKSDRHSYGFRRHRSTKMAIGALRVNLRSGEDHYDKYALDADIKGFFDNISHQWLLANVPLNETLKPLLEQ